MNWADFANAAGEVSINCELYFRLIIEFLRSESTSKEPYFVKMIFSFSSFQKTGNFLTEIGKIAKEIHEIREVNHSE